MIENFLKGQNDFNGITGKMILDRLSKLSIKGDRQPFEYSNFGYAALGLVLEAVYNEEYTEPVNQYVQDELGPKRTSISNQNGIVWHNGATDGFNCYIGFCPEETAVVILSNLSPSEKKPATVIGVKLLNEMKKEG